MNFCTWHLASSSKIKKSFSLQTRSVLESRSSMGKRHRDNIYSGNTIHKDGKNQQQLPSWKWFLKVIDLPKYNYLSSSVNFTDHDTDLIQVKVQYSPDRVQWSPMLIAGTTA